jgi:elongation factor P hydroxylase
MALISCALDTISNPTNCEDRGGIKTLYWTAYENVDWDAMIADPTKFDPATHEVLEWEMSRRRRFQQSDF